jgi:hypothetical protein
MSDYEGFGLTPVPLMTPERARLVARGYKALADQLAQNGIPSEAARAERQSQWWLTYSIALAVKPGEEGTAE